MRQVTKPGAVGGHRLSFVESDGVNKSMCIPPFLGQVLQMAVEWCFSQLLPHAIPCKLDPPLQCPSLNPPPYTIERLFFHRPQNRTALHDQQPFKQATHVNVRLHRPRLMASNGSSEPSLLPQDKGEEGTATLGDSIDALKEKS